MKTKRSKAGRPSMSDKLDTVIDLLRRIADADHPVQCGRCKGFGTVTNDVLREVAVRKGYEMQMVPEKVPCDLCGGTGLLGRKR